MDGLHCLWPGFDWAMLSWESFLQDVKASNEGVPVSQARLASFWLEKKENHE